MSKHTAGPWAANDVGHIVSNNGKGYEIGYVYQTDTSVADARLIACAPELLEALKEVLAHFDPREESFLGMRELICKAEGKEG